MDPPAPIAPCGALDAKRSTQMVHENDTTVTEPDDGPRDPVLINGSVAKDQLRDSPYNG
ncbi:hypothetical protein HOK021_34670 [Streptomyces hygroscopicus]|nr:hypothetical protein HOK021_34670 [Streptomyces hygroscopicus]